MHDTVDRAAGEFLADETPCISIAFADAMTLIAFGRRATLFWSTLSSHNLRDVLKRNPEPRCQLLHRVSALRVGKPDLSNRIVREFGRRIALAILIYQSAAMSVADVRRRCATLKVVGPVVVFEAVAMVDLVPDRNVALEVLPHQSVRASVDSLAVYHRSNLQVAGWQSLLHAPTLNRDDMRSSSFQTFANRDPPYPAGRIDLPLAIAYKRDQNPLS